MSITTCCKSVTLPLSPLGEDGNWYHNSCLQLSMVNQGTTSWCCHQLWNNMSLVALYHRLCQRSSAATRAG